MVSDESRLVRSRPIRRPLVQLSVNVAQVKELRLLRLTRTWNGLDVEQVPPTTHRPNQLEFVINGVKCRQAIDFMIGVARRWCGGGGRRSGRSLLRRFSRYIVMRSVVWDSFRTQIRIGCLLHAAPVAVAVVDAAPAAPVPFVNRQSPSTRHHFTTDASASASA